MAYADRSATGSRTIAGVIVAIIVVAVGYAFVTGLAVNFIKKIAPQMKIIDIQEPPPPPPDVPPPPPPPENHAPPPPPKLVTPPPLVRTQVSPVQMQSVAVPQPPTPPAPPAPPNPPSPPSPPAPPRVSQAAKSKGDPHGWFTTDDYPAAALRANAAGRVVARLAIGPDGRVSGCNVTSSSGNSDLDSATCRVAQRKGRYTAAKDENGSPIAASDTISIRWEVPKE